MIYKCNYRACDYNKYYRVQQDLFKLFKCENCRRVYYHSNLCKVSDKEHQLVCMLEHSMRSSLCQSSYGRRSSAYAQKEQKYTIDRQRQVGQGSYGKVYLAKDQKDNLVAIKEINKKNLVAQDSLYALSREASIHKKLKNPYIIRMIDYYENLDSAYIVMEYAPRGSLYSELQLSGAFDERKASIYFIQTCLGLDYLHKVGIVHRDIKPENLVLNKINNILICDFGWSYHKSQGQQQKHSHTGTLHYMAPELIAKKPYDEKVDIWSLGVLLFELTHNKCPFDAPNEDFHMKNILLQTKLDFKPGISQELKDLITLLLSKNPRDRPSLDQVFETSWMRQARSKSTPTKTRT